MAQPTVTQPGDEPGVPLRQRRAFAAAFAPGDTAAERAAAFAAGSRAVYQRAGVYADLTGDRGWPAGAYEQWLTAALEPLLGG
jgi:hypothetical protein